MSDIDIRQAQHTETAIVEGILLDAVSWLRELNQTLWGEEEIKWDALAQSYRIEDFFIAFLNGEPAG